jgi:hypothetical protein
MNNHIEAIVALAEQDGVFYQLGRLFAETQADAARGRVRPHASPGEIDSRDRPIDLFEPQPDQVFLRDFRQQRARSQRYAHHDRSSCRGSPPRPRGADHCAAGVGSGLVLEAGPWAAPGDFEGGEAGPACEDVGDACR